VGAALQTRRCSSGGTGTTAAGGARTGTVPEAKQKLRKKCRDGGWNSKQTGNSHGHGCSQSPKKAVHREIVGSPQKCRPGIDAVFQSSSRRNGEGNRTDRSDPAWLGAVLRSRPFQPVLLILTLQGRDEDSAQPPHAQHDQLAWELAQLERMFAVIGMDLYPTGIRPKLRNRTSGRPEPVIQRPRPSPVAIEVRRRRLLS
jgi:hypothetical protein